MRMKNSRQDIMLLIIATRTARSQKPVNGSKKTWRTQKKHKSSNRYSRSHQAYSPFVFHARKPRVLSLLQPRDHEGMVLDMHPIWYVDRIYRNDPPADKFINSWTVAAVRQETILRDAT